jgi:TolA-binding protein
MRPSLPLLLLALAGLAVLSAPAARAQVETREGIYLQNQIQELKRDIQALREQAGRSGGSSSGGSLLGGGSAPAPAPSAASGDALAMLLERVTRLEDEVRQLRGRTDELANAQKQMNDDLSKQIEDLNFRLDNSGAKPAAPKPPAAAPQPATGQPAAPAARRTPEVAMQEGNAALARRDYATAETAAREVLTGPKTPRAYDAQFLLAQALAGKKDFQGAAIAYDDTYNRSRTGAHAQDALLGLANALNAIGEKRAACATLDKLRAEFRSPRADLKEPIVKARQSAACR